MSIRLEDVLSFGELATRLGVKFYQVEYLLTSGRVSRDLFFMIGGKRHIKKEDVRKVRQALRSVAAKRRGG